MREIKFRVFDLQLQWFIKEWSSRDILQDIYQEGEENLVEIMQYTGLKDKNGKEIYEGDIVRTTKEFNSHTGLNSELYGGNIYEIKNNGWKFYLDPLSIYKPELHSLEIIGNIYENPKLIK